MRIVTFNFLAGGSARRSGHWTSLRQRLAPDIVLAQECRPPPPGTRGAWVWAKASRRGWGTAVFVARGAIRPIAVRGFAGWVVGGELEGDVWPAPRPLRVFSIHCPAGERGYLTSLGRIIDRLSRLAGGAELVVGGDLNVVAGYRGPGEPVRMARGERLLLDRFAGELGLIPCWQAMHPGAPLAQTLRWTGNRTVPYHCDGIFVPRAWRDRLLSAEVVRGPEWELLSDHNPVVADVALPASTSARTTNAHCQ
jgi:hypothetical protein